MATRVSRFAFLFFLVTTCFLVASVGLPFASADPPPVVADASSSAFSYFGAWNGGPFGVYLAPEGTASARIRNTPTLSVKVWALGQSFSVSIDGKTPTAYSVD